jgi:protein-L-isoaspartate(D-aspartate) O-methyltransferase
MQITGADASETVESLRAAMVDALRRYGSIRSAPVEKAMRAVPRHRFVPEAPLRRAYDPHDVVVPKRRADGSPVTIASEPGIVAWLLEQLGVQPGQRVLEIGAGTGYNAALLAELVGTDGVVTTIEYDADVAECAQRALSDAGYDNVRVICGDGAFGHAEGAPYDRLIVSTGAWDVPPAWLEQLASDGRLVVPLRLPGWNLSIAFERVDDCWRSISYAGCSFVPMEGAAGKARRSVPLGDDHDVVLQLEDDRDIDAAALGNALAQPHYEGWSGVVVDNTSPDTYGHLLLWLTTMTAGACRFTTRSEAVERGIVSPVFRWGGVAFCTADSISYVTSRRTGGDGEADRYLYELGAIAHGPGAADLADLVSSQIRTWDRDYRATTEACIELHPAGTPDERLAGGYVIDKRYTRIAITWPHQGET